MKKISEEKIEKMYELYLQGLPNTKIAKELGISNDTVSKYLKERYGIVKKKYVKQIDQDKFIELWNEGLSDKEIADYFEVKEITIKTYRTRGENAGKFNRPQYFSQEKHTLSDVQKQFVYGSLLGDLNISLRVENRNKNARIAIVHSIKQEDLFMKKVEILGEFMGSYRLHTPAPDKRTGKVYQTWRGNSKTHEEFTKIYNEIYINGVKTITKEFLNKINNPIALAYWFMDDGTYRGTLATHCFTIEEISLLIGWLFEKWNIVCTIQKQKDKNTIYISQKSRKHFEELIFPYMVPSMYYKLQFLQELENKTKSV